MTCLFFSFSLSNLIHTIYSIHAKITPLLYSTGVKDNKLTPNDFWLVPEFFDNSLGTARDASDYAIKPTVMSQQANLALNNPLIALLPADDSKQVNEGHSGKVPSPGGFQGQAKSYLPCDVHLLNLRTMNLEEKEALLILHRLVS